MFGCEQQAPCVGRPLRVPNETARNGGTDDLTRVGTVTPGEVQAVLMDVSDFLPVGRPCCCRRGEKSAQATGRVANDRQHPQGTFLWSACDPLRAAPNENFGEVWRTVKNHRVRKGCLDPNRLTTCHGCLVDCAGAAGA